MQRWEGHDINKRPKERWMEVRPSKPTFGFLCLSYEKWTAIEGPQEGGRGGLKISTF